MRIFFSLLLTFSWGASAEKVCGLYQAEDFGDRKMHSLTDFATYPSLAISYRILNAEDALVRSMMGGQCYCVNGIVTESGSDPMFQRLTVTSIESEPTSNCGPQQ